MWMALEKCIDPELGLDIVTLGLVYHITTSKESTVVTMTLTTPACPLAPYFETRVAELVQPVSKKPVKVEFTFDPPWSPAMIAASARRLLVTNFHKT